MVADVTEKTWLIPWLKQSCQPAYSQKVVQKNSNLSWQNCFKEVAEILK